MIIWGMIERWFLVVITVQFRLFFFFFFLLSKERWAEWAPHRTRAAAPVPENPFWGVVMHGGTWSLLLVEFSGLNSKLKITCKRCDMRFILPLSGLSAQGWLEQGQGLGFSVPTKKFHPVPCMVCLKCWCLWFPSEIKQMVEESGKPCTTLKSSVQHVFS